MKIYKSVTLILFVACLMLSCSKRFGVDPPANSSLTIVNAMWNGNSLIADLTGADSVAAYYNTGINIPFTYSGEFSQPSGKTPVIVFQTSDTIHPIYKSVLSFNPFGVYSLFIIGDTAHTDTLLSQDHPLHYPVSDSMTAVRFINLLQGNEGISCNIVGNSLGSEVDNLQYKSLSGFKTYAANSTIKKYAFEIHEIKSGKKLSTFAYKPVIFKSVTIVVAGTIQGGNNIITVFVVNNY